ncbi:hypothetical protein DFA_00778 [Cavenderia fasciculata]|uniref:Uncharacterized protein n=1 Tax=Cavenderia fasciculata TaxID=261658 RepID=F4PTT2_CACFS|nr:uncharacterized protein DFA_00778 [Cavenderia fasciculata]EGG20911.1 hypothetical protein DFA_00778 [Cavenderia fasciculata]|eukprot:XP_004358761.1 hypothetical protein DFA_00778 [Cavenderia fasciculata]
MKQRRNTFQFLNKQTTTTTTTTTTDVIEEREEEDNYNHENNIIHKQRDFIVVEDDEDEDDDDQYIPISTTSITTATTQPPQIKYNSMTNNKKSVGYRGVYRGVYQEEFKPTIEFQLTLNVVKDLKKICEEMFIFRLTKKDEMVQAIIKKQNNLRALKQQMFVSNPLVNYSKYTFDYTLPWSIICKILDQVWYDSSVCTCYYSDYLLKKRKESTLLGHVNEWEVELLNVHKQARSQCPMHTFHYANNIIPSIAIDINNPPKSNQNLWRYQLLLVSKRINQFISYNYFTKLKCPSKELGDWCNYMTCANSQTAKIWQHIKNPYCPFKKPKSLTLRHPFRHVSYCAGLVSHSISILLRTETPNYFTSDFKSIKSLTLVACHRYHFDHLEKTLRNCTSLNMVYHEDLFIERFVRCLPRQGVFKLLVPPAKTLNDRLLPDNFNTSTMQITNIYDRLNEMTNLHTFHLSSWHNSFFFNLPPSVTTLVIYPALHPPLTNILNQHYHLPASITTLKIRLYQSVKLIDFLSRERKEYHLDGPELIEYTRFGINTLLITYQNEITENQINQFKRKGYEYHGSTFKPSDPHKRQLRFIKSTNITPEIEYYHPSTHQQPNNPTLPFYIIEKIVKYSWNSYWCNCQTEVETKTKIMCPVHSWHKKEKDLLTTINRLRFGLTLVCKQLFALVSQCLITRTGFVDGGPALQLIYDNQYCVMAKSIQSLLVSTEDISFLQHEMYSQLKTLQVIHNPGRQEEDEETLLPIPDSRYLSSLGGSLRSLEVDWISRDLNNVILDLPLKKLYARGIYLFPLDEWTKDNILSQSLEAMSINHLDQLSCLGIFPNLRHLRFDLNEPFEIGLDEEPVTLPTRITKISFEDSELGAYVVKYNPQITRLTMLHPYANNDYHHLLTIHKSPQPLPQTLKEHNVNAPQTFLLSKQIIRYAFFDHLNQEAPILFFKWIYLPKQK